MRDYEGQIETTLSDGTPILVRQVRPEDKPHLEWGLAHLSPESQHFRFFAAKKRFSDEELARFTEIDHHTHDAWGAFDLSGPDPVPVGVARYVRRTEDPSSAEVAVTVLDDHQGRGLGTLLLGIVAARAVQHGIETFHSIERAENQPFLQLLAELNVERQYRDHGEVELTLPLCSDPRDYPRTPAGDAFRRAATLFGTACR